MNPASERFLRRSFVPLLQQLSPDATPAWGKMNVQQMVEHFADAVRIASGRLVFDKTLTPPDKLDRIREFVFSDKPFRENTQNPLLRETPAPVKFFTISAAINALQEELIHFFDLFARQPGLQTRNPFFGDLDFEQNCHLLHKHALHHLRQFGCLPPQHV